MLQVKKSRRLEALRFRMDRTPRVQNSTSWPWSAGELRAARRAIPEGGDVRIGKSVLACIFAFCSLMDQRYLRLGNPSTAATLQQFSCATRVEAGVQFTRPDACC